MHPQVLLVSSSSPDGLITAWDVQNGTALTTYKGNASPANGLAPLSRDFLVASQLSKGALHVWAWHKDQVHQRSFASEPLLAVACSPDGAYCAAGGASGTAYLWEVSTGRLLRSWPAHYKGITCLAFNDSGSVLASGGDDTLVNAWLLAEVLDVSAAAQTGQLGAAVLRPLHAWSDHTLPVTGLAVGAGDSGAVLASCSLDCSLKLRSLVGGGLLRSVALPSPVHCLALDPGEHAVYAGTSSGVIYDVSLISDNSGGGEDYGGAAGADGRGWAPMAGHALPVTALAISGDGERLVSGSADQSVRVWDLRSRQPVRVLQNPAKGPVTGVLLLDRPPFMAVTGSHASAAAGAQAGAGAGGLRKGPKRMQPLAAFAKYAAGTSGKQWEGGLVLLDGAGGSDSDGEEGGGAAAGAGGWQEGAVLGPGDEVAALREENARLQAQLDRALQAMQ